jgi:hypothetical protein
MAMRIQPMTLMDTCRAVVAQTEGMTADEIAARMNSKRDALHMLRRLFKRAFAIEAAARDLGLIGVGVISFRDNRLAEYQRRAMRLVGRKAAEMGARDYYGDNCRIDARGDIFGASGMRYGYIVVSRDGTALVADCTADRADYVIWESADWRGD